MTSTATIRRTLSWAWWRFMTWAAWRTAAWRTISWIRWRLRRTFTFCRRCLCCRFSSLFFAFFLNRYSLFKLNRDFYIIISDITGCITIDTNLYPAGFMFKHFITFIAGQKVKNLTRFTFFLADTKRLRGNCRPLRTKLVYQFFCAVADCQIIFHNITGNRTGLNINPVTFCLSNRSRTSTV